MSWIKENKFLAALGGGTLVGVIGLYFAGSQAATRYETAKEEFAAASGTVSQYLKLSLSPRPENVTGKTKALDDYRRSLETLQAAFQPFRPAEIKNVSPQELSNRIVAANTELRAAFEENKVVVPEPFFVGFEKYKSSFAGGNSTGILDYQLGSIKELLMSLASSKPSELKNLHRPELPEESGKAFTPGDAVARPFPLELTFVGTEESVRQFLTAITKPDKQYVVIRDLRISNQKKEPPRAADAQFDKAPAKPAAGGAFNDPFAGFALPGDDPAAAKPAEAPKATNSARILSQVLGNEQVQVFLRLDVMQFLPAKKLP